MNLNEIINQLPIDDVINLTMFYSEYRKDPYSKIEIQKNGYVHKWENKESGPIFYFKNKKYMFYSKNVVPILSLMTHDRNKSHGLEAIKEKIKERMVGSSEEALKEALDILAERIRKFRQELY